MTEFVAGTWYPIETAPKDRLILCICTKTHPDFAERKFTMAIDKWEDEYQGFSNFNNKYWPATHWTPIPGKPKEA